MREWSAKFHDRRQIFVHEDAAEARSSSAAVIANAASAHAAFAERFVRAGVPTLVEKPFSLTSADTRRVIDAAASSRAYLAASHVFLFAEYVHRFAATVREMGRPALIRLEWKDPTAEVRYGERKTIDSSVPVFLDVTPHVLSILRTVFPGKPVQVERMSSHGSEGATASMSVGGASCVLELARNAPSRVRVMEVAGTGRTAVLSFATEPGTISVDGRSRDADPDWRTRPSPLRLQLKAFLTAAGGGKRDPRLSPAVAYESNLVMDEMTALARSAQ